MRSKAYALLVIFMVSFTLTACFDSHEIGDFVYVSVMGIDKGEIENYKFTFQMPEFTISGLGGEGGGGKEEIVSFITLDAPSLLSAAQIANTSISKKLNFMHLKAIIISEDLAISGKAGDYITPLLRYRQIRKSTIVIVCKDKAQEFVEAIEPYSGELVTQTLEQLMQKSEETGYFPEITLNKFYEGLKAPYHALLGMYGAVNKEAGQKSEDSKSDGESGKQGEDANAKNKQDESSNNKEQQDSEKDKENKKQKDNTKKNGNYYAGDIPRTGGKKIELFGSTLFDGDKMVGKLTGLETQMLLLARGELKHAPFAISDPKESQHQISLEVNEFEKPAIKIDMSNINKPIINLKIKIEGSITEIQSGINYESIENKKIVEEAMERYLTEGIERTFAKCKELKTDVFIFGPVAAKYFLTIPEWEEYNWLSKFSESELKVEVDFTVRRTGKSIKTMPIFSSEGKE